MKGIYQHCGEQHLHRYLAEYEFRYNHRERNASTMVRAPSRRFAVSLASG
jgi:hypothetical protein